ncbi:hypothetical protein MAC_00240 [Metarhizium acridum CQMa 102]|uniref:Aminoglycoside phosphotransferase domain-containing protein n=1 Tax=Metarhizium acridum (strain CQMa 102) TaxID=655827 RepID=E9DR71_METAQ|nr:uncharacterized protein MAC_00240 [Metarhizium acridum CQMa 102]EFY93749.1 hypothetical protein MAC_00240 [Metarhizium acridum CQMa 102]
MPSTLELVGRRPITIESAIEEERNVINWASYGPATDKLYQALWEQRESIQALVRHHLALGKRDVCIVLPPSHWIRGGFNICVFLEVNSDNTNKKFIFRCPMPHKLAEARYPGSIDEKLSCEVGASIWVEENCPEIRSPFLFGFGFSDGCHNPPGHQVRTAYMVLEYLGPETGQMLSDSFDAHQEDEIRRQRLFRGMSRILLSLARIPQAQIGSFHFHNDGTVTLTNRPLSCSMMILENDGAVNTIQRSTTFSCTDAFVSDTLTFHDHRFLSQPNAVYSEGDCRGQMAVKTLLRVLSHLYIKRELRNGPFLLQLTDFHASNILVDKHWNVTGLIDLEWICALPSEMLGVPYWLTGCAIDQIKGEELDRFDEVRREFMRIFEDEEQAMKAKARHNITLSRVMQDMWQSKGVWFWHCLSSVNAMYFLLETHLYPPKSLSIEAETYLSRFWCINSEDVVQKKIADKKAYDDQVRKMFCE